MTHGSSSWQQLTDDDPELELLQPDYADLVQKAAAVGATVRPSDRPASYSPTGYW